MKLKIMFATIAMAAALASQGEVLPAPQTTGGKPMMQMMSERKSQRDIDPSQPVTKQDLSNILWAAWGITHEGKHTVATAMNRQELVLYVITATEVSRYNPEAHTLTVVNKGDFRAAAGMQDFAQTAPLNIVLAVDTSKQDRLDFQAYTAGAASQNIYLYCAQAGLKSVLRASFDYEALSGALKLPHGERILFVQSIGH
ncbi:MAG: nitroreductase family protein [Muribaculaceae bacterium]|nr:nitroreductase family protein [Muribaculaceae bacterium]